MLLPTTRICGATIHNPAGEALGTVSDFMIDTDAGAITYVVLAHGGVLGVGERLFAVPWRALTVAADGSLVAEADPATLTAATGIDKDAWPAEAARDWAR